ncbi:MAG: radical SAM protein [Candidatus Hermodarchaeota archaeon]
MKFVYGPVPSRRLGRSIGIDPIPTKTCNYQCIYCQLGKTTNFTNIRKNFLPLNQIVAEMKDAIKQNEGRYDYITFVGSGEPTLYKDLKKLIIKAKEFSNKPVCVITNGSLMYDKQVRDALMLTDVVLPSLDAGDEKSFHKINRPHPSIRYNTVIQGLIEFNKIYTGKFLLEIMIVKGVNDSKLELLKIKEKIDLIIPNRIDINVPIRPPTEKWVKIPDKSTISILNEIFKEYNNINFPEIGKFDYYSSDFENELLSIIKRHPMRKRQILESFSSKKLDKNQILERLKQLEQQKRIEKVIYLNKAYWRLKN